MDCTHAYTGIASETPVGVHSRPHLNKDAGIQFPYEERFIWVSNIAHPRINGTYIPILELMGHSHPLPWTVNDNECMK